MEQVNTNKGVLGCEEEEQHDNHESEKKQKVVVVLGATGAGKSKLAIDLAQLFPAEIINADSMQVYKGLDILTNKVPEKERQGIPHHLLGTVNSNVEFTSKHFRDESIHIIESIISRKRLPIIVGGTNYYIQALVSSFLIDDVFDDGDYDQEACRGPADFLSRVGNTNGLNGNSHNEIENPNDTERNFKRSSAIIPDCLSNCLYDQLKEVDPVAANRLHPNDSRKIKRYLEIYQTTGMLPSKLFRGEKSKKWGSADSFRYDCCFLWVDASIQVLDRYVKERVDAMVKGGLLEELSSFFKNNNDCAKGLRQAIGIREFEDFFSSCPHDDMQVICNSIEGNLKSLLNSAIFKMKANTCKLVRKQRRRLCQLKAYFGWNLHQLDVTKSLETNGAESAEFWENSVVKTSVDIVNSFLSGNLSRLNSKESKTSLREDWKRDLWTQFVCEACGDRVLRGAHEWAQHKLGRSHRRQMLRLKKKFNDTSILQD